MPNISDVNRARDRPALYYIVEKNNVKITYIRICEIGISVFYIQKSSNLYATYHDNTISIVNKESKCSHALKQLLFYITTRKCENKLKINIHMKWINNCCQLLIVIIYVIIM